MNLKSLLAVPCPAITLVEAQAALNNGTSVQGWSVTNRGSYANKTLTAITTPLTINSSDTPTGRGGSRYGCRYSGTFTQILYGQNITRDLRIVFEAFSSPTPMN